MERLSKIKKYFTPSFFEQLFFFCLLIGLIPCIIALSDSITPNVPSFNINFDGGKIAAEKAADIIGDAWYDLSADLPESEIADDALDKIGESKETALKEIKNFFEKFSFRNIIDTTKDYIGKCIKVVFYGIQLTKSERAIISSIYLFLLLTSIFYCFKNKVKKRSLYLVQGLLLSFVPLAEVFESSNIEFVETTAFTSIVVFIVFFSLSFLISSAFYEDKKRRYSFTQGFLISILLLIFLLVSYQNHIGGEEFYYIGIAIIIYFLFYSIVSFFLRNKRTAFNIFHVILFIFISASLFVEFPDRSPTDFGDFALLFFLFFTATFLSRYSFVKKRIPYIIFLVFLFGATAYISLTETIYHPLFIYSIIAFCILLYIIAAILAVFYFMRNGHIRSKAFFGALVVIALLFGLPNAFLFVVSMAMVRVPYLTIKQNLEIFKSLKPKRLAFLIAKSLFYWSPLLLFVIPGNKLSNTIYESSIKGIYTYVFDKKEIAERGLDKKLFVQDLNIFVDEKFKPIEGDRLNVHFANIEKGIEDSYSELSAEAKNQGAELPKVLAMRYRKEMMKGFFEIAPYFVQEDCGFHILFPTSCCIMNGTKSFLFSKIIQLGLEIEKAIENDLAEALKRGAGEATQSLDEQKETVLNRLKKNRDRIAYRIQILKKSIKASIMGIYNGINIFNLIMDLLLFILIIKSFMVVFARVAFSGQDEIYVTLLEPDKRMAKGEIKKCGNQYTILSSSNKNFYTSRSYEPSGRPPKFSIPQKTGSIFGRIRTSNYALNHIVMRDRKGSVYYNSLGGTEFVEWTLKPSEEVIFDLSNFVAMSEDIQLSTTYSFRLTSLLLGRFRFTTAKGPGKLVLITKGQPITSDEKKGSASVPVSRIIAFQKNTRFHVHSELNFVDVFMSSIYLQKKPGDLIVIDADEKGSARSGISKFIKGFLLPI